MQYLKVVWKHSHPDEPVVLYSELDETRREVRKVEIFRDGTAGYASALIDKGSTMLGLEPVPALSKIALDREFDPEEITQEEFEQAWLGAMVS